jgi:hypothetical protein
MPMRLLHIQERNIRIQRPPVTGCKLGLRWKNTARNIIEQAHQSSAPAGGLAWLQAAGQMIQCTFGDAEYWGQVECDVSASTGSLAK